MKIKVNLATESRISALPHDESDLGFGKYFSDHMLTWEFKNGQWGDLDIVPFADIPFSPAASVLQYSQQVFEGMKVFHGLDDEVRFFRSDRNYNRMQSSAARMCMPSFDEKALHEAVRQLVTTDKCWIPSARGCALYLRPTFVGTEPYLGVRPSSQYLLFVISSPVSAYYQEGFNPVSILIEKKQVRAVRGGVGGVKTGGNYGATLQSQVEAKQRGFSQVMWLDANNRKFVEEVGTMNVFFVIDGSVVTSPLSGGTILPGVTRESVISLLNDWGIKVLERQISIDEVLTGIETGVITEAFGTGTAAIIAPIGSLDHEGEKILVADGSSGEIATKLFDTITGIQTGQLEDRHGWTETL